MHKTISPVAQEKITYAVLPDGMADVWIRKNEKKLPENEDGPQGVEADEIYFKVTAAAVSEEEITADMDFWFEQLKDKEEGCNADHLAVEVFRKNKKEELSQICQATIYAGVDIEISSGKEHFSLKYDDQVNLFGNQIKIISKNFNNNILNINIKSITVTIINMKFFTSVNNFLFSSDICIFKKFIFINFLKTIFFNMLIYFYKKIKVLLSII